MNKGELIKALADKAGMTQKDAGIVVEAFVDVVTEAKKNKKLQEKKSIQKLKKKLKLQQLEFLYSKQVKLTKKNSTKKSLKKAPKDSVFFYEKT